ncbi:MAG: hypothetical protein RL381_385 [Actinomycetota bacterium]|jgi:hypothetical protein
MSGSEKVAVVYFFSLSRKDIPFAFLSMARDRARTRKFTGISFSKMLGTGSGDTFTPRDANLYRWGMVILIERDCLENFDSSSLITSWRRRAKDEFRVVLSPLSSHGSWAGRNPFSETKSLSNENAEVVAITRARIRWKKNRIFWNSVPPVVSDLRSNPGLIAAIGIGEAPIGLQGTFSLWSSATALRNFAYKGDAHQKVIAETRTIGWYSEELFARFEVLERRGEITSN